MTDSTVGYSLVETGESVTWNSDKIASVAGTEYTNVSGIGLATGTSAEILYYDIYTYSDSTFADASDGWQLPTITNAATYNWWTNNQLNSEVRMIVHFTSSAYAYVGPVESVTDSAQLELYYDGTYLYVTDEETSTQYTLGKYTYAMIVMDQEQAVIYGIADWPDMGTYPATMNSITVDYTDLSDPFTYVTVSAVDSDDVVFRVDSCQAVAGYFPSTYELQYYPDYYFPVQSIDFTFKSIALYGNDVNIISHDGGTEVGTIFNITDGTATVNGTTFKLLKSSIRIMQNDDDTWTTYFGGQEVMTTEEPTSIYFGGEWSLTASVDVLTQTTNTQATWVAGEFAFEKEDFAACGLLVAGICLVGLGMTGPRSGTKIGVLLMICGGAGLIYLTLI